MLRLPGVQIGQAINRSHPSANGLLAHWLGLPSQAGGARLHDMAGNFHGTGVPRWVSAAIPGGADLLCPLFDGSGQYATTTFFGYDIPTNGTVSWWQKPSRAYNSSVREFVWGTSTVGIVDFEIQKFTDNNVYCGFVSGANPNDRVVVAASADNWSTTRFTHWALTWIGGGVTTLYIDGIYVGANGGGTAVSAESAALLVGTSTIFTSETFAGAIADMRIYDRCFSASEVKQLSGDRLALLNRRRAWWDVPQAGGGGGSVLPIFRHHYVSQGIA